MAIKKLPSTGDVPRSTGVPESLAAGGETDSAGFPWAGRTFDHHETAFASDDGRASEAVTALVLAVRNAAEAARAASGADAYWNAVREVAEAQANAIAGFAAERFLVPMLAEAGELGETPDGRTVEKSQELSIVAVAGPDGRRVLPIFTSVETLSRWNPEARPIPVPGAQAALAAAQDDTELIIIDPGTPEREFGVRRPALESLALGKRVLPAWADPAVQEEFRAFGDSDPRIESLWIAPGELENRLLQPEVTVLITIAGEAAELHREVLAALQARIAASEIVADRVDSLTLRPVAAA
ncbi:SseB family protein [Leucobacter sp. NPDC077196]|uniref:SseB family protein n=1 Tax=Leucobacter sp. NPDC077196 TaxID=3154959 RepID=UPI0034417F80